MPSISVSQVVVIITSFALTVEAATQAVSMFASVLCGILLGMSIRSYR